MALVETLESRTLLAAAPQVTSIVADNRGEVNISLNGQLDPATVNRRSVQVFTAGKDQILGTADDVGVAPAIRYAPSIKRIVVRANITPNVTYRVRLVGSRLKTAGGISLDGEFSGRFPSGNGVAGGNFAFQTRNNKGPTPSMRLSTSLGVITLKMLKAQKPVSATNFINYANGTHYDNIFFTRNIPGFIIQGGSLEVTSSNTVDEIPVGRAIRNEFTTNGIVHNTRGTVAFAKQGGNPDSATNQFFFNLGDNSSNLDNQNGGFTVFAQVANPSSLKVMDAIAGINTVVLHNPVTGHGQLPDFPATGLTDVPVQNKNLMSGTTEDISGTGQDLRFVVTSGMNPSRDLILIRRTALVVKIIPIA